MSIVSIERKNFLKWMVGLGAGLFGLTKAGLSGWRDPKISPSVDKPLAVKRDPRAVARKNPFA